VKLPTGPLKFPWLGNLLSSHSFTTGELPIPSLKKEIPYLPFAIENQSIFILISCFPNILWAHMPGVDKFFVRL
jgi:hypothetical protein